MKHIHSLGLFLFGVIATLLIGAAADKPTADKPAGEARVDRVGAFVQVNDHEIINTGQINYVGMSRSVSPSQGGGVPILNVRFINGKAEAILFTSEDEAKAAWAKTQAALAVEPLPLAPAQGLK